MKTYTLTLTDSQLSSLKTFIERTELRGREVHNFIELVQAINEAEKKSGDLTSTGKETSNKKISIP